MLSEPKPPGAGGFPMFRPLGQGQRAPLFQQYWEVPGCSPCVPAQGQVPQLSHIGMGSFPCWGPELDALGPEAPFSLKSPHQLWGSDLLPTWPSASWNQEGLLARRVQDELGALARPASSITPQVCGDLAPWEAQPQHLGPLSVLSPRSLSGLNLQNAWSAHPHAPHLGSCRADFLVHLSL